MDTPFSSKGPRRKLKKIMKKSKVTVHASTQNLYQRKLKSAINVSLNSSRNIRSLQANNRSLASNLEKIRQDFRQVHDHNTHLLEENHALRERILELERLEDATSSYIEEEVKRRVEQRLDCVQQKLQALKTQTTGFLEELTDLSELCCSRHSLASEDNTSAEVATLQPSFLLHDLSNPGLSARFRSLVAAGEEEMVNNNPLDSDSQKEQGLLHEMSLIMEQSVLYPTAENVPVGGSTFSMVTESSSSASFLSDSQKKMSRLPLRVPRQSREPRKHSHLKGVDKISKLNCKLSAESNRKLVRRETFTITSDEALDTGLISEMIMPQFLVSGNFDGGSGEPNSEVETLTSEDLTMSSMYSPKYSPKLPLHSPKQNTRSPGMSSTKDLFPTNNNSDKLNIILKKAQSPSPLRKSAACKLSGKTTKNKQPAGANNSCTSPVFYVANEFSLLNAHKEMTDKLANELSSPNPDYIAMLYGSMPLQTGEEHTILPSDDMELTVPLGSDTLLTPLSQPLTSCVETKDIFRKALEPSRVRSRSKIKQIDEGTSSSEENVPDAVTMRISKPGQLVFIASRKESDGTRRQFPIMAPKARSKPKRHIAEMLEQLPQTEPKSIFDFHDKTPTITEKCKAVSVFSLSADESTLSPLLPLGKSRSKSKPANAQVSPQMVQKEKTFSLLRDNTVYEQAVKESSPPKAIFKHQTRSRSRVRSQKKCESLQGDGVTYEENLRSSPPKAISKQQTRSQSHGRSEKKFECLLGDGATYEETLKSSSPEPNCKYGDRSQSRDRNGKKCENLLGDGVTYEEVLKSSPPETNFKYRSRSQSLGRSRKKSVSDATEGRASQGQHGASPITTASLLSRSRGRSRQRTVIDTESGGKKREIVANDSSGQARKESLEHEKIISKGRSRSCKRDILRSSVISENSVNTQWPIADVTNVTLERYSAPNQKQVEVRIKDFLEQGEKTYSNSQALSSPILQQKTMVKLTSEEKNLLECDENIERKLGESRPTSEKKADSALDVQFVGSISLSKLSDNANSQLLQTVENPRSTCKTGRGQSPVSQIVKRAEGKHTQGSKSSHEVAESRPQLQSRGKRSAALQEEAVVHSKLAKVKRSCKNTSTSSDVLEVDNHATFLLTTCGSEILQCHRETGSEALQKLSDESSCQKSRAHQNHGNTQANGSETGPHTTDAIDQDSFGKESHHLVLQNLKYLRTPVLAPEVEGKQRNSDVETPNSSEQGPRVSRIVKRPVCVTLMSSNEPNSSVPPAKKPASPVQWSAHDGKRRRAATKVNYAELPLNTKLRRGDPFTSHYCNTDKLNIFKSPKAKARRKAELRQEILGTMQNLANKKEVIQDGQADV